MAKSSSVKTLDHKDYFDAQLEMDNTRSTLNLYARIHKPAHLDTSICVWIFKRVWKSPASRGAYWSSVKPLSFTTFAHRTRSSASHLRVSCGLLPIGVVPCEFRN